MNADKTTVVSYALSTIGLLLGLKSGNRLAVIISAIGLALNIASIIIILRRRISSKTHTDENYHKDSPAS